MFTLSNDTGVDCEPSTNDGGASVSLRDGGYLISEILGINPVVMLTLAALESASPYRFVTRPKHSPSSYVVQRVLI